MSDVVAIVPRGEGTGFRLAGLKVMEASSADEAREFLTREIKNENNGVILIDEDFTIELSSYLRKHVDESTIPLVVGIPIITRWEYLHERTELIERLIRRAVGYKIKLSGD